MVVVVVTTLMTHHEDDDYGNNNYFGNWSIADLPGQLESGITVYLTDVSVDSFFCVALRDLLFALKYFFLHLQSCTLKYRQAVCRTWTVLALFLGCSMVSFTSERKDHSPKIYRR